MAEHAIVRLVTNVDIFRIQFSELSKLTGDRADMLRQDISAHVHAGGRRVVETKRLFAG